MSKSATLTTLALALSVAACGDPYQNAASLPISQQELTVLRLYDAKDQPWLDIGYSVHLGWHTARAKESLPEVMQTSVELSTQQTLDLGGIAEPGPASGPRFRAGIIRPPGFDAGTASSGFNGRSDGAGSFSGTSGAAGGFSAGLGGALSPLSCDARPICDFVGLFCNDAQCSAAMAECRTHINTLQVPAELVEVVCLAIDLLVCVFNHGSLDDSFVIEYACRPEFEALATWGADFHFAPPSPQFQ